MRAGRIVTGLLLVLAAALIVIGVSQGEPGQVWQKAASICLECVGIG